MRVFFLGLLLTTQVAFASVDDSLLLLAPPATTVLTGIDVNRASASRSGIEMLRQAVQDQDAAQLRNSIGLDVRRDIRELLIVGFENGVGSDLPDALLARGTFVSSRLIATGRSHGAMLKHLGGVPVLIQAGGSQTTGKATVAIAFPQPGILAVGELSAVYKVIAPRASSTGIGVSLREQVNQVGPHNDVWYATSLPGSFVMRQVGDSIPSQLRESDLLQSITRSSGGLQFGQQEDSVALDLVARTPDAARSLSYLLRLASGLAQLPINGSPGLLLAEGVVRSMRVSMDRATLQITSSVRDTELERALASGP